MISLLLLSMFSSLTRPVHGPIERPVVQIMPVERTTADGSRVLHYVAVSSKYGIKEVKVLEGKLAAFKDVDKKNKHTIMYHKSGTVAIIVLHVRVERLVLEITTEFPYRTKIITLVHD